MENWHLFAAAFTLSLVDLSVLGSFLWYQFSSYFAWHLCPMIVNRICELIAFVFTGGMLPSLFAIVQVPLSLFSTAIYADRRQHVQNKLLLAVYCTMLVYEFLVALLMVKMGHYLKCPRLGSHQFHPPSGQQVDQAYISFHMFALFTQSMGHSCPYVTNASQNDVSRLEGFVTVQQPDGKRVMLGKILDSKIQPSRAEADQTNVFSEERLPATDELCIGIVDHPENSLENVQTQSHSGHLTSVNEILDVEQLIVGTQTNQATTSNRVQSSC